MSADVEPTGELTRALQADKPIEKVERRGTIGVKKRWTERVEERETEPEGLRNTELDQTRNAREA